MILLQRDQNRVGGRVWTVEYASPANELLQNLDRGTAATLGHGGYMTRLRAFVDPRDMDVDPVFVEDPDAPDVDPVLNQVLGMAHTPSIPASLVCLMALGVSLRRRSDT